MPSSGKLATALVAAMSLQPGSAMRTVSQLSAACAVPRLRARQPAPTTNPVRKPVDNLVDNSFITSPWNWFFGLLIHRLGRLWKARLALEVIKVDVVAHVLLTGISERLVVPALEGAQGQRLGYEAAPTLAGQYLVVYDRNIPFAACLTEKGGEQRLVLGRLAEFFQLERVLLGVVQQARVLL